MEHGEVTLCVEGSKSLLLPLFHAEAEQAMAGDL